MSHIKASKSRTPTSQPSKSSPKSQKISPSKGNSRSPHTPSPSKTGLVQGRGARASGSATPSGRGSAPEARRGLGFSSSSSPSTPTPSSPSLSGEGASLLWVDKYRPRTLKAVIGQQGDQSCANKLLRWLQNWHRHHSGGATKPPGRREGACSCLCAHCPHCALCCVLSVFPPLCKYVTNAYLVSVHFRS